MASRTWKRNVCSFSHSAQKPNLTGVHPAPHTGWCCPSRSLSHFLQTSMWSHTSQSIVGGFLSPMDSCSSLVVFLQGFAVSEADPRPLPSLCAGYLPDHCGLSDGFIGVNSFKHEQCAGVTTGLGWTQMHDSGDR